jgi:hypothetical protein
MRLCISGKGVGVDRPISSEEALAMALAMALSVDVAHAMRQPKQEAVNCGSIARCERHC